MKNYIIKAIGLIFFHSILSSCEKDNLHEIISDPKIVIGTKDDTTFEDDPILNNSTTFGIRHDKELTEYETIATNEAPYNSSKYPEFAPVVSFNYSLDGSDNGEFVATGVLIAPNWVLTAGHNFYTSDEQTTPALVSGINVLTGNDPNNPLEKHVVEELVFHPTWLAQDELFVTANDLCLVKLSTSITTITPSPIYARLEEPIGNTVWYCGFGDYSSLPNQDPEMLSKKHAIENTLDRKISGIESKDNTNTLYFGGLVAFDFDTPSKNINSLGDDYLTDDEKLLGTGTSSSSPVAFEGTTVQGDSGGPLFCKINGKWQVIGILSGGIDQPIELASYKTSSYGDISVFTRVATSIDWINSVIE